MARVNPTRVSPQYIVTVVRTQYTPDDALWIAAQLLKDASINCETGDMLVAVLGRDGATELARVLDRVLIPEPPDPFDTHPLAA